MHSRKCRAHRLLIKAHALAGGFRAPRPRKLAAVQHNADILISHFKLPAEAVQLADDERGSSPSFRLDGEQLLYMLK